MSFLAVRGQVERARDIPSLWQELMWSLPLGRVVVQAVVVDDDLILGLDLVLPQSCILCEIDVRTGVSWALKA